MNELNDFSIYFIYIRTNMILNRNFNTYTPIQSELNINVLK